MHVLNYFYMNLLHKYFVSQQNVIINHQYYIFQNFQKFSSFPMYLVQIDDKRLPFHEYVKLINFIMKMFFIMFLTQFFLQNKQGLIFFILDIFLFNLFYDLSEFHLCVNYLIIEKVQLFFLFNLIFYEFVIIFLVTQVNFLNA